MSNFQKKGQRENKLIERRTTKAHVKAFYAIMGDMQRVYDQLDKNIDYTEDNINEYVTPVYGRELDHLEKMIVLGKIQNGK